MMRRIRVAHIRQGALGRRSGSAELVCGHRVQLTHRQVVELARTRNTAPVLDCPSCDHEERTGRTKEGG